MRHAIVVVAAVIVGVRRKRPVKGLTQARDPMLFWSPFRPDMYGSEQPGQRCVPVWQPLVLQLPQTKSSNARNVCFIHD